MFNFNKKREEEDRQLHHFADLMRQVNDAQQRERIAITWAQECLSAINCFVPDHRFSEDLNNRIRHRLDVHYPDFAGAIEEMYKPVRKRDSK